MHIGNLRTALYAYLIAKKKDGDFILRIEDTDQERYVEGAVDVIYDTLRVAGLNWDEGPDIGGPVGPYVQSERMCGRFRRPLILHRCMTVTAGISLRKKYRKSWMPAFLMSSGRRCLWTAPQHSMMIFTAMLQ